MVCTIRMDYPRDLRVKSVETFSCCVHQREAQVSKCMNDVLLNDEDMSAMYLTEGERSGGKPRNVDHHQEIEMLFENYLLQA